MIYEKRKTWASNYPQLHQKMTNLAAPHRTHRVSDAGPTMAPSRVGKSKPAKRNKQKNSVSFWTSDYKRLEYRLFLDKKMNLGKAFVTELISIPRKCSKFIYECAIRMYLSRRGGCVTQAGWESYPRSDSAHSSNQRSCRKSAFLVR